MKLGRFAFASALAVAAGIASWSQAANPAQSQQPAGAQQSQPTGAPHGTPSGEGAAASVGLFAYPRQNQGHEQQSKDESECFSAARQQTGIDPANPQASQPDQSQQASGTKQGGAGKGAAKGAAGGAAIGAIAGDAGTGAAAGATAGAVRGRRQKKKAEKEQEQQAQAATKEQQQQQVDTFRRSMSACLDARGYSVK
jgi:hypothetical protein